MLIPVPLSPPFDGKRACKHPFHIGQPYSQTVPAGQPFSPVALLPAVWGNNRRDEKINNFRSV